MLWCGVLCCVLLCCVGLVSRCVEFFFFFVCMCVCGVLLLGCAVVVLCSSWVCVVL